MTKYNVYIGTPNKMIDYRGRIVRTPVELNGVTEKEIGLIRAKINSEAIMDYNISEIEKYEPFFGNTPDPIGPEQTVMTDSIVDLEEKMKNPDSILNKLLLESE